MICHGCQGKGWVDSQYKGAMTCPVCGGSGEVGANQKVVAVPARPPRFNKNTLLLQFENWLQQQAGIVFGHVNKTMNTYNFMSKTKGRMMGLVWVSTYGSDRIYIFKGDFGPVDPKNRVKYQNVWGGYPQFVIQTQGDIEYAKRLVSYALANF